MACMCLDKSKRRVKCQRCMPVALCLCECENLQLFCSNVKSQNVHEMLCGNQCKRMARVWERVENHTTIRFWFGLSNRMEIAAKIKVNKNRRKKPNEIPIQNKQPNRKISFSQLLPTTETIDIHENVESVEKEEITRNPKRKCGINL